MRLTMIESCRIYFWSKLSVNQIKQSDSVEIGLIRFAMVVICGNWCLGLIGLNIWYHRSNILHMISKLKFKRCTTQQGRGWENFPKKGSGTIISGWDRFLFGCFFFFMKVFIFRTLLQGKTSHKFIDMSENAIMNIYYTSRPVLFFMCAGNEAFYAAIYLNYFATGPISKYL